MKDHPLDFKTYEIDLISNSSYYFFTDGMTDQIGGSNKLMYGKKRILKQIQKNSNVSSIVKEVTKDFTEYQNNQKRRDDIAFFGFSVA